jgi:nitrogen-specific signal transduction histidine kinase
MDFYEKWLEYDYNPWILFDSNGRVKTLNQEAQFLLAEVTANEIFELAVTYANQSYGFKTTMIDLEFGKYEFFGIMVGYEDNENIAIRLYQRPPERISEPHLKKLSPHNIYTLINLAISTSSITRKYGFTTNFDPAFPEVKIDPETFIKLLNEIINCIEDSDNVEVQLSLKTGETIKFDGKRHPIFQLSIYGKLIPDCNIMHLKKLAIKLNGYIIKKADHISLEAPLIV